LKDNRPDLERGVEPNGAYYIQNQPKVAGRTVDFMQDLAFFQSKCRLN